MKRKGIMLADALAGMLVLGAIATVLTVAISRGRTARIHLSDDRSAVRLAEAELTALQAHAPTPAVGGDRRVTVRTLPDSPALKRFHWVEVVANVNGRERRLVGLTPEPSTTQPAPGGER